MNDEKILRVQLALERLNNAIAHLGEKEPFLFKPSFDNKGMEVVNFRVTWDVNGITESYFDIKTKEGYHIIGDGLKGDVRITK